MSATKLLLVYSFLSTLALWVISSSVMALYSFCQPLPHSSAIQSSLPSSRLCILNIAKMNYVQTELLTQLLKHVPFAAFPISSGWSLHFPVAQVKPFSINLVPLSHTHTTSNPWENYYSSTFKTCPESNCFHWDLLDPIIIISCLCYYYSLLTVLPSLLFFHHSLFSIVSESFSGFPFYSKSFDNGKKFCYLKCGPFSHSTRGNWELVWDAASQALPYIK